MLEGCIDRRYPERILCLEAMPENYINGEKKLALFIEICLIPFQFIF